MNTLTVLYNSLFLIITTVLIYKPAKRIVQYQSQTTADYVIVLVYIFNCIPVLLDLVIGVPQYMSWYSAFQESLTDEVTCLLYNAYNVIVIMVLCHYAKKRSLMYSDDDSMSSSENTDSLVLSRWRTPVIDIIFIILPLAYAYIKCGITVFVGYATLSQRGVNSDVVSNINQLIMVGLFFCTTRYFSKRRSYIATLGLITYSLLAIWINGKRYIIVTFLLMVFYLYQMRCIGEKKRANLKVVLPVLAIGLVAFSMYYILNVKITSTLDTVYSSLRIDFGRDDVTKFVINKVLLKGEAILEYPGQTFLSAIFMLVPRSIWPTKPYPHYRYLTAAIFGTTIYNIPSGMTPSIFEMSICNFGWVGIISTIFVLICFCHFADQSSRLENKLLLLLIVTNVLTQSLDAALSLIIVLMLNVILGRIRFTFGNMNRVR